MEAGGGGGGGPAAQLWLPPGFRFFPTDEELLLHYLSPKLSGQPFSVPIIREIELYKFDPWLLPSKATYGEREWYFFSPRDRKYPNGSRPNRMAGSGYWKATGTDKVIMVGGRRLGIKKALVFYVGRAPRGSKSNWIMHEYRLCDAPSSPININENGFTTFRLDEWVLCRIYRKSIGTTQQQRGTFDTRANSNSNSNSMVNMKNAPFSCTIPITSSSLHRAGDGINRASSSDYLSSANKCPNGLNFTTNYRDGLGGTSDGQRILQREPAAAPQQYCHVDSSDGHASSTIEEEVDSARGLLRPWHAPPSCQISHPTSSASASHTIGGKGINCQNNNPLPYLNFPVFRPSLATQMEALESAVMKNSR